MNDLHPQIKPHNRIIKYNRNRPISIDNMIKWDYVDPLVAQQYG
jgi:hypothetical protein